MGTACITCGKKNRRRQPFIKRSEIRHAGLRSSDARSTAREQRMVSLSSPQTLNATTKLAKSNAPQSNAPMARMLAPTSSLMSK